MVTVQPSTETAPVACAICLNEIAAVAGDQRRSERLRGALPRHRLLPRVDGARRRPGRGEARTGRPGAAMRRIATIACALLLALFGPAFAIAQPAAPTALASQTSGGGGVTVKVTPKDLAADAPRWQFELVFDTHSVELNHDVVSIAALIDAAGRSHVPLAWDGDPPGGHHRKGVLSFKPLGAVDEITLRIREVGVPERMFRWSLKGQAR